MSWVNRGLTLLGQNLNGLVFLVGLGLLLIGVRAWSKPAAYVIAGAIVMAIGAIPYLMKWRLARKGRV